MIRPIQTARTTSPFEGDPARLTVLGPILTVLDDGVPASERLSERLPALGVTMARRRCGATAAARGDWENALDLGGWEVQAFRRNAACALEGPDTVAGALRRRSAPGLRRPLDALEGLSARHGATPEIARWWQAARDGSAFRGGFGTIFMDDGVLTFAIALVRARLDPAPARRGLFRNGAVAAGIGTLFAPRADAVACPETLTMTLRRARARTPEGIGQPMLAMAAE